MKEKSGTMLESGINNLAAALIKRNVINLGIECTLQILGKGMNHRILIKLSTGESFDIKNSKQWFAAYTKLRIIRDKAHKW